MLSLLMSVVLAQTPPVVHESRLVTVGAKRIRAEVVRVQLGRVRIKVGLAKDRIGPTESLLTMAKRKGALAAINGSFFDAYTEDPIKCPYHTVVTGGEVAHIGNTGSVIGFWNDGRAAIDRPQLTIAGAREGNEKHPFRWYAYWLNRRPTASTVTIFTKHWGRETGLNDGRNIVVRDGKVAWIEQASQPIPPNGWVLYQRGITDSAFGRITMGSQLSYRVLDKSSPDGRWSGLDGVHEAVGAGPRLVKDGKIAYAPASEGFSHEKILLLGGARSLAGLTANGELLLVASSGTVREMAGLMLALGCRDAMNLDGGASSTLVMGTKVIRPPGRDISNGILVLPK